MAKLNGESMPPPDPNLVAKYLEGRLTGAEQAEFERLVGESRDLVEWLSESERVREDAARLVTIEHSQRPGHAPAAPSRVGAAVLLVAAGIVSLLLLPQGEDASALLHLVEANGRLSSGAAHAPVMASMRGAEPNEPRRSSFRSGVLWASMAVWTQVEGSNSAQVDSLRQRLRAELATIPLSGPVLRSLEDGDGGPRALDLEALGTDLEHLVDDEWFRLGAWATIVVLLDDGDEWRGSLQLYFGGQASTDWPQPILEQVRVLRAALVALDTTAARDAARNLILRASG